MTESFSYRGRGYFLVAALLAFGALGFPLLLIEHTRHGPVSRDEMVLILLSVWLLGAVIVTVWQSSTVAVNEHSVARIMFRWKLQEIRWDAVGTVRFFVLHVPRGTTRRFVAIRPRTGRWSISLSDRFAGFERFGSLVNEIAQRRKIEVQFSDAYRQASS